MLISFGKVCWMSSCVIVIPFGMVFVSSFNLEYNNFCMDESDFCFA